MILIIILYDFKPKTVWQHTCQFQQIGKAILRRLSLCNSMNNTPLPPSRGRAVKFSAFAWFIPCSGQFPADNSGSLKIRKLCVLISAPPRLCERIFCFSQSRGDAERQGTKFQARKTRNRARDVVRQLLDFSRKAGGVDKKILTWNPLSESRCFVLQQGCKRLWKDFPSVIPIISGKDMEAATFLSRLIHLHKFL